MFQPTQNVRDEVMKFFSSQGTHLKSRPELRCFVGASGDDFHLLLGMTKRSIQQIAGTIGFTPEGYSRKAAFEKCGKSDYITPMCGPELTGYDFIESIKLWMTDTNNREWSVAEVWLSRKDRGVGMATLFVSHVQAQPLEATLKAVPDDAHLWLDYTTLRQCQDDFEPERVAGVIKYLSNAHDGTRAVLDEPSPTYLNRSFCIFEVACTVSSKLHVDMSDDTSFKFVEGAFPVDAKAATSTKEKHKTLVDGYILGQWGSFIEFNDSVSLSFMSAAVGRLVGLLAGGAPGAQEQAARALANLAVKDAESRHAIGRAPGAVERLQGLVAGGAPGAQEEAARALGNLGSGRCPLL